MPHGADLIVRSRRVLLPHGWADAAIVIRDGRIRAIVGPGGELPGGTVEDVGGLAVLPGLVDSHAHFRDPGFTHKEDWATGSAAAAVGGMTFVADMPNVEPPPTTVERFEAHRANAAAKSIIDFGHNVAATVPEEIAGMAAAGATAFKVFMARDRRRSYPHLPGTAVEDHAHLFRVAEAVAATGRVLMVHAHDSAIGELFSERRIASDGRGVRSYALASRDGDGVTIDSGIATALAVQRATGVRLHVLHVSTTGGLAMIRAAKAEGRPVTAEVNPFQLFVVNDWATVERHGPWALGQWVPAEHAAALWDALLDGTIDVIGSDHTPHAAEEKPAGWDDMYATPGGSPTIQHALSLFLTAVHDRRLPLERVVDLWTRRPAGLLGIDGQKGGLRLGMDGDLVVVDLERRVTIRNEDVVSKCGWTVLDGREVVGVPVMTVARGRIVARDGRPLAEPGSGRYVVPDALSVG